MEPRLDLPRSAVHIAGRRIDLATGEVEHAGDTASLTPKAAATLAVLCEHAGEVVAKDTLIDRVWPDAIVTDDGLWHAIAELRRLFDDDPKRPRVIETLPRRGYRLIAPVEHGTNEEKTEKENERGDEPTPPPRWIRLDIRGGLALVTGLALALALSSWAVLQRGTVDRVDGPVVAPETSSDRLVRGIAAFERYTAGHNERAIELLEAEVDGRPTSAPARAALADAYAFKGLYYSTEPWWRTRALTEARRAVELDPELPEAHKALGVARVAARDRRGALAAYRRAVELRPSYHQAINNLALLEAGLGDLAAAASGFARAVELVADDADYRTNYATVLRLLGLHERAEAELDRAAQYLAEDPTENGTSDAASIAWQRVLLDLARGLDEAARLRLDAAVDAAPRDLELATHAAEVALYLGRPRRAAEVLDRLTAPWSGPRDVRTAALLVAAGSPRDVAVEALARATIDALDEETARRGRRHAMERTIAYLLLDRPETALDWLETLVDAGYRDRFCLGADPAFAPLHDTPRFRALLDRLDRLVDEQRTLWLTTLDESG